MEIEIIQATIDDVDFLIMLRMSTMVEHLEAMGLYLSAHEHRCAVMASFENAYIIHVIGKQVGLIKIEECPAKFEIIQFQILPDCQGLGIGQKLLQRITAEANRKRKFVSLSVLKNNPAIKLYEKNGFSVLTEDQYEYHMRRNID